MRKMSEEAFYESPRLKKAMERLSSFPLSFLCAGSGYGKSLLVRHFFQTSGTKSLYFLFSGSELSAQYERFLCLLDEKNLPLAQALRVVGFPGDEWSFLKAMKLVKKALKNEEFYLCLDDAQAVAENPAFASFLRYWEQEKIPGGHLFVLSRELPEVPLAHYQLKNEVGFLEGKTLALNEKETRDFLLFRGLSLSEELVRKIAEKSEGWIAAVELYVRAIKETGQLSPELGIQALFKEAFYGALKAEERLLLSRLAPFEEFTIPFAIEATGDAEIAPLLSQLAANNAFTAEERGFFRFHALFREFLLQECPDDEEEKRVYRRAGLYRLKKNDPAEPFLLEWFIKADAIEDLFERMNDPNAPRWELLSLADLRQALALLSKEAYRDYPYAYLHSLFLFFVWGGSEGFPYAKALYDEMEGYYGDGLHPQIAGELALLKRLFFPDSLEGDIDPLYAIARDLYPRSTILLRKEDPFTFGLPMLLESEYALPGHLEKDLLRLSENAYERVCPGFGHGSPELAQAEGALLRGDFAKLKSLIEQSQVEAKKEDQFSLLVSGDFVLMVHALFYGKKAEAKKRLEEMGELVSSTANRKDLRGISRSRLLEQYWLSSSFYGALTHEKEAIPSGVFLGQEKDFLLHDGLGVGKAFEAEARYAFGDYSGAYATSRALLEEKTITLLPRLRGLVIQGLTKERLEGKDEGWEEIKEALLLGEEDGLILPFALETDLVPFLERFAHLKGGNSSYRARLLHEALYHQSVTPSTKENAPLLSAREKQLLVYLEEGKSRQEIAGFLYVQENTIKSELASLYKKLGVHSRDEALSRSQKK
jgi:LuxR family transcriptional regulator, maltose regulon positive regulatory protein